MALLPKKINFKTKINKTSVFFVSSAFLLTLLFRGAYALRHSSFGQDLARDLILTERKMAQGQLLVGYGPKASVGDFYLPPFYYQVMLVLGYVTNNYVWTMKWFVIIVESFTPIILYLLLKELRVKQGLALGLSALYALSGLPTIFGSFAWNPNTIPFFASLSLLGWVKYLKDQNCKWPLVIGPVLTAVCFHLHYQAAVLLPFLLLIFVYSLVKKRQDWRYWLPGMLLALLTFAPYVVFEIRNDWQNTRDIISYFQAEHSQYYQRVSKPAYVFSFLPGFWERVLLAGNLKLKWLGRLIFFLGSAVWGWLLITGGKLASKTKKLWLWLAFYFGLILLMLRVYKGDKIDYYMSTLYFFPFLLLAAISLVSRYCKLLVVLLMLLVSFRLGRHYAGLKPSKELWQLQKAVAVIEDTLNQQGQTQTALLFHQDDFINSFGYIINQFSDISVDQNSQNLVQICSGWQTCRFDQQAWCRHSRAYTYASLLKSNYGFDRYQYYQGDNNLKLVIGRLNDLPEPLSYALYQDELAYGSDLIYPEYYFYNQPQP